MVILYGANGMSEAMYLCFLLGAVRYLMRWTVSGHIRALVWTACYLALAVLTRYEAVAAIAAVIVVVFIVGTTARDPDRPVRDDRGSAASRRARGRAASAHGLHRVVRRQLGHHGRRVRPIQLALRQRLDPAGVVGWGVERHVVHQLVLALEQTFSLRPGRARNRHRRRRRCLDAA